MTVRARTPVVLQLEATECGAAALASVLAYHGLLIPLATLRLVCGVSRDGSRASNIVRAGRHYGLDARAFRKETGQLADLPLPAILFWGFNHFVVLESIGPHGAWLNDPAFGHRFVPAEEFDESFTGVVLTFTPNDSFRTGGQRASPVRIVRGWLRGARGPLLFGMLASIGLIVPALAVPAYVSLFVDQVLVRGLDDWLPAMTAVMAAVAVIAAALEVLQRVNLGRLRRWLVLRQSTRFLWHVLRLPVGYFTQRHPREVASRVALNDRLAPLFGGDLVLAMMNAVLIVVFACVMLRHDIALTLVGIGIAGINLLALIVLSRRQVDLTRRRQVDGALLRTATIHGFEMIDTLKATGTEALFLARWAGYHAKVLNATQGLARAEALLTAVPVALGLAGAVAVVVVGGQRVMEGTLTIGMLLGFQILLTLFSAPIRQLVDTGARLRDAHPGLERLDDVLRQPLDPTFNAADDTAEAPPTRIGGTLRMDRVSFGYAPLDAPLIEDFELRMPQGTRIGVVGRSGSGKSTIGRLAVGLYQPWGGEISLDGRPFPSIPRATLRHSIAYVGQGSALFPGTIRDNLGLWDPTLPDDRLIQAAHDALIHADIIARPLGLDHPVAENGRDFSGGQRQRMMIARALAFDPLLIVLDEATNELDAETEARVLENIRRRGCGCIIIAHRLSTIRFCDEIIVMRDGRIAERGTHDTLLRLDGEYRSLACP